MHQGGSGICDERSNFHSLSNKPLSTEQNHKNPDTPEAYSADDSARLGNHNLDTKYSKGNTEYPAHKISSLYSHVKDVFDSYRVKQFWRDPRNLFEILALIVLSLYTNYTRMTLNEIRSSSTDTRNLAVAASKQADASRIIADAAKSAAETAKDALTSTVENARMDQRAWVAADSILSDPPRLKEGIVANVAVNFRNSGKSPALYLSVVGKVDPVGSASALTFSYENGTIKRFGVLGPGGICSTSFAVASMNPKTRAPEPLTGTLFQQLVSGNIVWYFHGVVRYRDVFGRSHLTTFCYYMHDPPGATAFGGDRACEGHNNAGDGDNPQ